MSATRRTNVPVKPGDYSGKTLEALPFVTRRSRWSMPESDDYSAAFEAGAEYARHLRAWLHDNPDLAESNALYVIMRDLAPDFAKTDDRVSGYAAGFIMELQRHLAA